MYTIHLGYILVSIPFTSVEQNAKAPASVEEMSEATLLRDILFVFQGIEGKWMHYNQKEDAYRIDEKVHVQIGSLGSC